MGTQIIMDLVCRGDSLITSLFIFIYETHRERHLLSVGSLPKMSATAGLSWAKARARNSYLGLSNRLGKGSRSPST